MLKHSTSRDQYSFFTTFEDQLDHQHKLYILANTINWQVLESSLEPYYSLTGRPAKPIRRMCGLLMLKHIRQLSDEAVVEQYSENPYFQYFCGGLQFEPLQPCASSELVHFRNRIEKLGLQLIHSEYLHAEALLEKE